MGSPKTRHKHTHKLIKSGPVWKCALPDCTFFVYFKQEYILIGRKSVCWECGDEFLFNTSCLNQEMPICNSCAVPELPDDVLNPTQAHK